MAVKRRKGAFYIYFRPFKSQQIGLKVAVGTKTEAKQIEAMIVRACRSGDYAALDATAREALVRMFANQGWEIPSGLASDSRPKEELTFWKACELFLKYPDVRKHPSRWRHEISLSHIVDKLGKDRPLKSLWVPDLRAYQAERINEGAAPGTINRELSTLSRLFGVMVELQLTETNPVRLVKRLSMRSGERQVYLSPHTVKAIAPRCPAWFRPILWAGYYTGMRRGEILGLTRKQANLSKRIISLGPDDTKEGHWKRVPIHSELAPILAEVLNGPALISGKVFPLRDGDGVRELGLETFKNPWERACKALGLDKPWPRFHDLRHTWRTNARRSGVDPQIAESIMGHWFKGRSVNDRYGRISDQELLDAIDRMTFDHGETEIFVARGRDVADRGKM